MGEEEEVIEATPLVTEKEMFMGTALSIPVHYRIIPLFLLLLLSHQQVSAGMYRCVEKDGSVKFTDTFESEACRPINLRRRGASFDPQGNYSGGLLQGRAAKYEKIIRYNAVRFDIDPHLIRAVIRTESGFDPRAVSKKGAKGLMQLMPGTARELRVSDPFNPEENIAGGTMYLRTLLDTFKQDVRLALAAYNAGPTIVKKERRVPMIPETRKYVNRVLKYYREYKNNRA